MRVTVTISASMNEAVVVLEPNWLDRLLGREQREFMALRSPAISGGSKWWDDSRRAPVRGRSVIAALDYAYWKADREARHEAVRQTFGRRLAAERNRLRAELGIE